MLKVKDIGEDIWIAMVTKNEVHTLDVPELKEKLHQEIVNRGIKKLVLDLSQVKIITSSGIGIFLNIHQNLKSGLRLASPQKDVKKVLDLTKVTSVIKTFNSVEEAIQSFRK